MASSIKTVGVVGTGVIGASWTALFLANGLRVLVSDPAPGAKDRLATYLSGVWPALERLHLHHNASISNWTFVGETLDDACAEVDFIQENAPEKLDLKLKLLATLDAKTKSNVIIASSSSGLPSSQFVTECKLPGRILIGHPFNPPHLMPLVEVVPHPKTSETAIETAMNFYKSLGKSPVLIKQETPGFVANRLQAALVNEAYSLVQRGIVSAEACDTCVTTGVGLRWALTGPFMTNVLGGGGGKDGFRHLVSHLGPAAQNWTKDMNDHAFIFNDANIQKLDESVQKMLAEGDVKKIEEQRDEALIDIIKRKQDATALQ
jgi:3-hydroxyacyl-CoA dehydrogenase